MEMVSIERVAAETTILETAVAKGTRMLKSTMETTAKGANATNAAETDMTQN